MHSDRNVLSMYLVANDVVYANDKLTRSHWIGSPKNWLVLIKMENPTSKVTVLKAGQLTFVMGLLKNTPFQIKFLPLIEEFKSPIVYWAVSLAFVAQ